MERERLATKGVVAAVAVLSAWYRSRLAEKLQGTPLPAVAVEVEGKLSDAPLASALKSEFMLWLVRCGVPVIEPPDQTKTVRPGSGQAAPRAASLTPGASPEEAELLLVAEASVTPGDSYGPLQAARYRLQVRLVDRRTGEVIAVARRAGEYADPTRESASLHGLEHAATSIAAELIPKLTRFPAAM